MNRYHLKTEHYVVGSICPAGRRPDTPPSTVLAFSLEDRIQLACTDWLSRSRVGRLVFVRDAIGYAASFQGKSRLSWTFSTATVSCAEASQIAARWDETGEPPVFSLIALDFDAESVRTAGLAALVGLEIEASNVRSRIHDAMNLTARLARHVLLFGPSITAKTVSAGPLKATLYEHAAKDARRGGYLQVKIQD